MSSKAILIIGSIKGPTSASESIGTYLLDIISEKNIETKKVSVGSIIETENAQAAIYNAIDEADIVILTSPLYVDCPPYLITKLMEEIRERRRLQRPNKRQYFFVISNCGYPEPNHNSVAMDIYREFSKNAGFVWSGGASISMGLAFQHKGMQKLSKIFGRFKKAFNNIATDLINNTSPSPDYIKQIEIPVFPIWLYNLGLCVGIIIITIRNLARNAGYSPYVIEHKAE